VSLSVQPPGDAKFQSQLEALREAFDDQLDIGYADDGPPVTIIQKSHLLIREGQEDHDLGIIRQFAPHAKVAERRSVSRPSRLGSSRGGVTRVSLGMQDALATRAKLEKIHPGIATVNHVVSITPTGSCPASEPLPAGVSPNPAINPDSRAGLGVNVLVIDTGLVKDYLTHPSHPWLASDPQVERPEQEGPKQTADPADPNLIKEYAGHGTFIAGLLKCVAPGVHVTVSNALRNAGAIFEDELGDYLLNVLPLEPENWPHIISLSAGANSDGDAPLRGLERFIQRLSEAKQTVLVAAAGNNGNRTPFWPAALAGSFPEPVPGVVSVGALRQTGTGLACFSDFGPWVSVFAPGERLVNAFVSEPRTYEYRDERVDPCRYYRPPLYENCTCVTAPPQGSQKRFSGMANWSGTSFSTPIVAGMIAAQMSKTHQTSREAVAALLAGAGTVEGAGRALLPPGWTPSPEGM
jgi:subtilisin family serine protease